MIAAMPPPSLEMPPVLTFSDVSYRYASRTALSHVSFEVPPGCVTLLLGPNGAGKTTLFSLASRLLALQGGDIALLGASLARSGPEALRPLGIVFQQSTLDIDLTVRQNLRYFAALHGLTREQASDRIAAELERIGLKGRDGDQVRTLNGGHRRRLEIARALLTEPKLLLLDEPTVGLDQPTRRALVDYLHRLARERGLALLWATHLFDEAEPGDRLVILAKGQVRAAEAFEDLISRVGEGSLERAFGKLTEDAPGVAA